MNYVTEIGRSPHAGESVLHPVSRAHDSIWKVGTGPAGQWRLESTRPLRRYAAGTVRNVTVRQEDLRAVSAD